MQDKKIQLIQQLLAKAESTTPEEAEALTEHAERLMVKYGIEQAMLNSKKSEKDGDKIVQEMVHFSGAFRLEWISLGHQVCMGLGSLRTLKSTYKNRWARLYVIGYASDVARATLLIASLQAQCQVATRAWWKTHKSEYQSHTLYDQEAARRSFAKGFGAGAGKRIRDNRLKIVEEQGTGTELVLVSRDQRVQEHFDGIAKGVNRSRGGKGSALAQEYGFQAGQNANTGEKGVGQRRQVSA